MGRMKFALGFSGRIKSGKTTIARRVATEPNVPFASFGDFLRETNGAIQFTNHFQPPFFVRRASRVLPFFTPSLGFLQTNLFGKPDYDLARECYLRSLEIAAFLFDG